MLAARISNTARISSWLLQRKLYRGTPADLATALAKGLLIRTCAAACAFASMVLIAWIAAFARAVLEHGWSGFRTLGAAALSSATMQAARYERNLIPVLVVWAAFLLLAPVGYTIAFRSAAVAAGALGALNFTPPSFLVTPESAGFARGVAQFTQSWNGILLLVVSVPVAYLLHQGALSVFDRLDQWSVVRRMQRHAASPIQVLAAQACRIVLALVVLLVATWSGTVVWLAASHTHGGAVLYGLRGGLVLSDYLLALGVVAVLVAHTQSAQGWLLIAMPLAASLGAAAKVSPVPHDLIFSVARGELARVGTVWGGGSLWGALFVGFPACLFGVYLMARVRPVGGRRT